MKGRPYLGAVALLVASPVGAAFERLPAGPESAALGEVLALSPDAVFGNPAPARSVPDVLVRVWGSRPFALPELGEAQASVVARLGPASVGLGFRQFGSRAYGERELRLTAGWAPAAGLEIGVAGRGLLVAGTGFLPHRSFALDAGLRFRPGPDSEIAAVLEALLGEVPGDPAGRLRRTAFGGSRRLGSLELRIEVQRREDSPLGGIVGVEWTPARVLVLRAGVRADPPSGAWGFTVRMPGVELAAASTHAVLGRTVRVGIAVPGAQP